LFEFNLFIMKKGQLQDIVGRLQQIFVDDNEYSVDFALALNDVLYNFERRPSVDAFKIGRF